MPRLDHFGLLAPWYDKVISNSNIDSLIELGKLPVAGHLLDIGGGTGRVASSLVGLLDNIEVLDLSMGMLRMAREKNLRAICASSVKLPFPNQYFSRVLVVDALHHFELQDVVINEIWRVLKPGGLAIIIEPNYDLLTGKLIRLLEKVLMMNSKFLRDDQIVSRFRDFTNEIQVTHIKGNSYFIVAK
jgi:ubiquinone/menaquinone biosynthesis C-methylase UbiE